MWWLCLGQKGIKFSFEIISVPKFNGLAQITTQKKMEQGSSFAQNVGDGGWGGFKGPHDNIFDLSSWSTKLTSSILNT